MTLRASSNLCYATILACGCTVMHAAQPADIEKRIDDLLARMTLEEKLGQMSQSTEMRPGISEQIRKEIRAGRWGSFLNAAEAEDRVEAQRIAIKESRLGIPLLFGRDVIHGYRTVFPIPLGQAATWNPDLVRQAARVAGREAASAGIHWTFAPMLDITRDPRWGRIAETLGEDPHLASVLGVAMVRGFQGDSLDAPDSIAACAKHYVGYGASEAGRDYNSTWIPEIQLRDVFLPPFQAVEKAGVATFMSGFNAINGIPATGNEHILRQILQREWGFDGFVVSDYNSVIEMVPHGYAADHREAAVKAVRAGVDMEMVSTSYYENLKQAIEAGQVDSKMIDDAVRRILRLKFRLGLFDRQIPDKSTITNAFLSADALDVSKRIAEQSVVLLKNENNALPLASSIKSLAVIGPLADAPVDQMGSWVMDARPEDVRTPLAALRERLGNERVIWSPGLKTSRDMSTDGFGAAVQAASRADAAVLFLGEEQILSGEAHSRAFLNLPGAQEALVEELAKTGKPLVVVILAGRPLTFGPVAAHARAVLYAWHPGTMGGPAIADLLFGASVPSGRLPVTFPRTVGQVPIYYAHLNTGRPAPPDESGIPTGTPLDPTGFTSRYLDVDFRPEYPFGYGLSYTSFVYSDLTLSTKKVPMGGKLTVSAVVANTGSAAADEVVQLYTRDLVASVAQPVRQLRAFRRVHLKPGAKQRVEFTLSADDLAFHNAKLQRVTEPGTFHVWIAPDSVRGVHGEFVVE